MSPEVTFAIAGQWRSEAVKGAALKLLQHPRLPFGRSFMQLAGRHILQKISHRPSLLKRGIPPFCKGREGGI